MPRRISTAFLAILVLPYVVVVPTAWASNPGLFSLVFHKTFKSEWLLISIALVPLALGIEYGIHGLEFFRKHRRFPKGLGIQGFWQEQLTSVDHFLLATVAVGEEFFYRVIWLGVLLSLHLPIWLALGISSIGYGLNHLSFGRISVISKSISGLLYGALFFYGGSIWLPAITHVLQNFTLFQLTKVRRA